MQLSPLTQDEQNSDDTLQQKKCHSCSTGHMGPDCELFELDPKGWTWKISKVFSILSSYMVV